MKASELRGRIQHCLDAGIIKDDDDVEFLLQGDDWNSGSVILNTMVVCDGDGNSKMFLTNFEEVML